MSIASKDILDLYEIYQNLHEESKSEEKKVKCKDGSMAVDCTAADAEWEKQQKNKSQNQSNNTTTVNQDDSTTDTNNNKTDNKTDNKTNNKTDNKADSTGSKYDSDQARVDGGINSSKESIKAIEDKLLEKERLRKAEEEKKRQEETQRARERLENQNNKNDNKTDNKTDNNNNNNNNTDNKTDIKTNNNSNDTKEVDDYLGKSQGLLNKDDWLKKTANSPAAKSGAFTDDERWAQQLKHRKWQQDNNRGAFKVKKEKSKVYTNKIDAFLNNKKVGDAKGTNNYKILSPLEQEMESFQPMEEDANWYKKPDGVNKKTGETSSEMDRQHSKKGNPADKALRVYRNFRKVGDTFMGNADAAAERARNPQGIERVATGLTDKLTGDKTDYDRRGPSKKSKDAPKTDVKKSETATEGFDAYDSVMSYLMGTSQAESIEEANHIMMEMDGKTIMDIKKIMNESQVNRADILGGTPAAKNAQRGIGKYTPGPGVTKDFQLDPNFKIKA